MARLIALLLCLLQRPSLGSCVLAELKYNRHTAIPNAAPPARAEAAFAAAAILSILSLFTLMSKKWLQRKAAEQYARNKP